MNANSLNPEVKRDIPNTPECRIAELMKLPLNDKKGFVPPVGQELQLGPFKFKVTFVNFGQFRFTANLIDVIIKGVNDEIRGPGNIINPYTKYEVEIPCEKSSIIDPHTGKEIVK